MAASPCSHREWRRVVATPAASSDGDTSFERRHEQRSTSSRCLSSARSQSRRQAAASGRGGGGLPWYLRGAGCFATGIHCTAVANQNPLVEQSSSEMPQLGLLLARLFPPVHNSFQKMNHTFCPPSTFQTFVYIFLNLRFFKI